VRPVKATGIVIILLRVSLSMVDMVLEGERPSNYDLSSRALNSTSPCFYILRGLTRGALVLEKEQETNKLKGGGVDGEYSLVEGDWRRSSCVEGRESECDNVRLGSGIEDIFRRIGSIVLSETDIDAHSSSGSSSCSSGGRQADDGLINLISVDSSIGDKGTDGKGEYERETTQIQQTAKSKLRESNHRS